MGIAQSNIGHAAVETGSQSSVPIGSTGKRHAQENALLDQQLTVHLGEFRFPPAPPISKPQLLSVGAFFRLDRPGAACCRGFVRKAADFALGLGCAIQVCFCSLQGRSLSGPAFGSGDEVRKGRNRYPYKSTTYARTERASFFAELVGEGKPNASPTVRAQITRCDAGPTPRALPRRANPFVPKLNCLGAHGVAFTRIQSNVPGPPDPVEILKFNLRPVTLMLLVATIFSDMAVNSLPRSRVNVEPSRVKR